MLHVNSCLINKSIPCTKSPFSELILNGGWQTENNPAHKTLTMITLNVFHLLVPLWCVQGKLLKMIFLFTNFLFSCIQSVVCLFTEFLILIPIVNFYFYKFLLALTQICLHNNFLLLTRISIPPVTV